MAKYSGYGVVLRWDPAGGSSYTAIGQIFEITPPGVSRTAIEVTEHDGTDSWKEFIKGLKDGGELTFGVVYDPVLATHDATTGVLSDWDEDTTIPNWQLVFPDAGSTTWSFPGFITNTSIATPIDEKMSMSVTVKISDKPTLA